jgi:biopolymer transport protein ExbB
VDIGGFFQTVESGGPAMWALLVLSIVAIAIVIERLMFFASQHSDSKGLLRALGQKIAADDLSGAVKVCQQNKGMLPKILEFGLRRGEKNRADITDALSIALMEHLNTLERNLGIIGTIAVISPFVGLFGTVLGIIRAFQDIALKGNSTPAVVAAGVSEALVTTAAGLFVAVVSVIFFNYFKSRIKSYNQEMIVAAN